MLFLLIEIMLDRHQMIKILIGFPQFSIGFNLHSAADERSQQFPAGIF
jgi:hypothetical protein